MIAITASKIAGLTPRWARFPGFSVLFNPPGSPFRVEGGLETLSYKSEPDLDPSLFSNAAKGIETLKVDHLLQTYGFCALPFSSYHVTAFDLANVSDLDRCHAEFRETLNLTLGALPTTQAFDTEFLRPVLSSELVTKDWNLTFEYKGLRQWGSVMAIELSPLDDKGFNQFIEARTLVSRLYRQTYGVGANESFKPHLSLGYFMNKECSALATVHVDGWDDLLRSTIGDSTISFSNTALYCFTDMATFCRLAP